MSNLYTDIACEIYSKRKGKLPNGVEIFNAINGEIKLTSVEILKSGLRREKGKYITLETPNLQKINPEREDFVNAIAQQIRKLLPENGSVLVVGIGNRNIIADSLGPNTADKIFVTNSKTTSDIPLRSVAAVSPGVAGATGVDTLSIIKGIVQQLKPSCTLVIDSLCTSEPTRMGCSVQITNTGLTPKNGSNINFKSLGIPVIALGVPTMAHWPQQKYALAVTPKDIDAVILNASCLLALAINRALQPALSITELCFLTN